MKLLFAFLLVGLCVLQITRANPVRVDDDDSDDWESLELTEGPSEEGIVQDIGAKAKLLIHRVRNYIVKKVHSALDKFKVVQDKFKNMVNKAIDTFKPKLQHVIDVAEEKIKKKAAELKKDAKSCLAASGTAFKELLKTFLISETHCVTDELHRAVALVQDVIKNVLGGIHSIETLPGDLTKCLQGEHKFDCVKKNVWNVAKAEGKALKTFVKEVSDGTQYVLGLETRLATCALTQIAKATDATVTVVEKFPECVLNKAL